MSYAAGTVPLYAWDFGDGQSGSGSPITHTYALTGTYTALVTVTNPVSTYTATTVVTITTGYRLQLPAILRKP